MQSFGTLVLSTPSKIRVQEAASCSRGVPRVARVRVGVYIDDSNSYL